MKFKLDECVNARLADLMEQAGHEVMTVKGEGLRGISDQALYERCIIENRALVTLDKHFSNVLRYPPEATPGIVVLRGPDNLFTTMRILMETLVQALTGEQPTARLWIVEPGRFRIHEPPES
ncbi:DUF5615 family PIN-like protein [Candidatus Bipolaricaulota bacterium]|nr:DUF5615 family PIN-like protein [Candidatus Bipolaricaulota bacterium]